MDGALSWEGSLKKRGFQTPGNTLSAESVASLGSTEGNITGRNINSLRYADDTILSLKVKKNLRDSC